MKILVCDDHALFREGVMVALRGLDEAEGAIELLEAADGAEALALARANDDLDLVLLDLQMPGTDGWAGLAALRTSCPTLPVVILSATEDPAAARRAIEAGAAGFVPKSTRGAVLRGALRLVLAGGVYLPPQPHAPVVSGAGSATSPRRAQIRALLTPKQHEVLRLLARGLTNAEIGGQLGISLGTVKTHVVAIFQTLEVSNRTEAALALIELSREEGR